MRSGNISGQQGKDFYGNLLTTWKPLKTGSKKASTEEVEGNTRARSVSLRVAERTKLSVKDVIEGQRNDIVYHD